jgi:hypothetical protein
MARKAHEIGISEHNGELWRTWPEDSLADSLSANPQPIPQILRHRRMVDGKERLTGIRE